MTSTKAHLPPEAPLAMPAQCFDVPFTDPAAAAQNQAENRGLLSLRRAAVFFIATLTTLWLLYETLAAFSVGGVTPSEIGIACLFAANFFWISLSGVNVILGFLRRNHDTFASPRPANPMKVALLVPAYNEDPGRVFANATAMLKSLNETDSMHAYSFFVLSDTRDGIAAADEVAMFERAKQLMPDAPLFYRRRADNAGRKAGNIEEWVRRWGGAYDAMVVLDADSVMEGGTIRRLTDEMASDPAVGLFQTVPRLIKTNTLFGRLQQFATAAYGQTLARGFASWFSGESNYWGHNAIIRTRAFAASAGLPNLKGTGPFGGVVMSHDFVEAALLRRAGWKVRLMTELGGSYEETPPTLIDHVVRDQRWCQGNLQHVGVVAAAGLHPLSRFHLLHGIMAYMAAPMWLMFICLGLFTTVDPMASIFAVDHWQSVSRSLTINSDVTPMQLIFAVTIGVLFLPKVLGFLSQILRRGSAQAWGGNLRTASSFIIEVLLSAAVAPVLMVQQTLAVVKTLAGREQGWNAQRRSAARDDFGDLLRCHAVETILGLGLLYGIAAGVITLWLIPVVTGLVLAAPLSSLLAKRPGALFDRFGLLVAPEQFTTPPIVMLADQYHRQLSPSEAVVLPEDEDASALPVPGTVPSSA
ncbi:MAG: glucans biosynthesis glucosyltransferase MdoH [Parvibaculaceae bacterium]|nr:glucans biosynthesis glucosyltransferase MdoH [Parvibaculaceae bacterium]